MGLAPNTNIAGSWLGPTTAVPPLESTYARPTAPTQTTPLPLLTPTTGLAAYWAQCEFPLCYMPHFVSAS